MRERSRIIACAWDFDKTLIPGDMQAPMFREYGINAADFWRTINSYPKQFLAKGIRLSETLAYFNCLLMLVKQGRCPGLSKAKLMAYGQQLHFFPGIPEIFTRLNEEITRNEAFQSLGITLEHYVISSGHVETIRGSLVAPYMETIFASEFLEGEMFDCARELCRKEQESLEKQKSEISNSPDAVGPEDQNSQKESEDNSLQIPLKNHEGESFLGEKEREIQQVAYIVDTTQKTRCLFEINKGCNKNASLDVNATIDAESRRIPFKNMIYIADGPSDAAAFAVVRGHGGKAYAVYNPEVEREFEQSDRMLAEGRVDAYGPADYREGSVTTKWLHLHVQKIAQRIVDEEAAFIEKSQKKPPAHIN